MSAWPRSEVPRRHQYQTTRIRRGASIGANATVVCGTTVGRYAFVAAGAVVTKDYAESEKLKLGGHVSLTTPSGEERTLVVRGIYDPPQAKQRSLLARLLESEVNWICVNDVDLQRIQKERWEWPTAPPYPNKSLTAFRARRRGPKDRA